MSDLRDLVQGISVDLLRSRQSMFGRTIAYHVEPVTDRVRTTTLEILNRQDAQQAEIEELRHQVRVLAEVVAELTGQRVAVGPPVMESADLIDELIRLTDRVANLQSLVSAAPGKVAAAS